MATGIFAVATLVLAGATPAMAAGGSPACGAVIAVDTTLTADLVGCVGDGLVVAGAGVTLDLAGHRISGNQSEGTADVGIRVLGSASVTITGGSVDGFNRGVVLTGSPASSVTRMQVHDNQGRGIVLADGSDDGQVQDNVSEDNRASAVAIVASDGAVVTGNRNQRNLDGAGVRLEGASNATVRHNALNGNAIGVQVTDGADDNWISDNLMRADVEGAVFIDFSVGNVVTRNRMLFCGTGVSIESSDRTTITDNQVLHSVGPDGMGVQVYGNDNLVARNTLIDSVRYGIEVDDFQDEGHSPVTGNVLRDNVVNGAGEGIAIGPEAGGVVLGTLIEHNTVSNSVDDGIQLLGPSTGLETSTVTRNVAVHNGDLGIAAVPGTVDGGGNHAAGNGNPLQCLNISCR